MLEEVCDDCEFRYKCALAKYPPIPVKFRSVERERCFDCIHSGSIPLDHDFVFINRDYRVCDLNDELVSEYDGACENFEPRYRNRITRHEKLRKKEMSRKRRGGSPRYCEKISMVVDADG